MTECQQTGRPAGHKVMKINILYPKAVKKYDYYYMKEGNKILYSFIHLFIELTLYCSID